MSAAIAADSSSLTFLNKVEKALGRADKRTSKAIDSDDYEKLREAIAKSADDDIEQRGS